jgi:mannose-6-phosphate isomerase-like protein (cupin superfamily)
VYVILRGSGSVMVDGEPVPMHPGACIAVSVASTRQVCAGDAGLVYLAVCASDG